MRGSLGLAALVLVLAPVGALTAVATPLEPAACSGLDHERNTLATSGVLDDLHVDAEQAKALSRERLERVQRYVEISGQILFRCVAPMNQSLVRSTSSVENGAGSATAEKTKGAGLRKRSLSN